MTHMTPGRERRHDRASAQTVSEPVADKPRWPDGAWLIPATALGVAMWAGIVMLIWGMM